MNIIWRISHYCHKNRIIPIAKLFEYLNMIVFYNSVFGQCEIGKGTCFHHHALGCTVHPLAKIGDNVVIGAGAVLLGDITIGDNSIIGANAVVVKSIHSDSIAVGVPASIKS